MLADNQGHNEPIQGQGLAEDEHNEHANKKLVLVVAAAHIISANCTAIIVGDRGISAGLGNTAGEQTDGAGPVPHRPDAGIAHDANAAAGRQARYAGAEPRAQVRKGRVDAVRVDAGVGPGLGDRLGQDDGDDEAVDADDARHDDRDDVLHHRRRVADAGVDEGDAGLPRPPRRAPVGQAGGGGDAAVSDREGPRRAQGGWFHVGHSY
mmetsp:Transcript_34317/g.100939  ORF Transcript_34317/g.100939 Transcript_34317/m.100939 type:complete len:208 (+) Transcript_34317:1426-2049(+)